MNTAHKGRRAEHRARALLEAEGFAVVRAAASKGVCDLVAWNATSIRLVSVKSGAAYASTAEREAPSRRTWRTDGQRHPIGVTHSRSFLC